jgi:hypothetical protein
MRLSAIRNRRGHTENRDRWAHRFLVCKASEAAVKLIE